MDPLSELVNLLDTDDRKLFRQFLQRKNKRSDVKNLQLLKLVETDDIAGVEKLYNATKNRDAYHALRKRLQDNLLLFLSQKAFEDNQSDTYHALRLVIAGRFLLENDVIKLGLKCLDKAERLAEQLERFNLLNELLLLKLQYAHLPEAEDFETLSTRFQHNQLNMQREAKLNLAYAFLRIELQHIHLEGKVVNLNTLMLATIRKYKISVQDLMTYKSVYQILFIANEYAAIQHNYGLIERYVERTDGFMQKQTKPTKTYLFYHISIIYFLANFHLRRKKFGKSKLLLKEMLDLMTSDTRYFAVFYMRYQLLSALNMFFTGSANEAVALLREALSASKPSSKAEDVEDVRICLSMFLALCDNRESLKQLTLLNHTNAWYENKMGMLWTIRKNLMEILVQAQFANIEVAMSRLVSFRTRYKKYLLKTSEERVLTFLNLVERYLFKPDVVFEPSYQKKVANLRSGTENDDIFIVSFISWLVAKWEKKPAYEVMMNMISNGNQQRSRVR